MIDIEIEKLLAFGRAAALIEKLGGQRPSVKAIGRWGGKGIKGVVLDTIWIGGRRYTSEQAIHRFISAVSAARNSKPDSISPRAEDVQIDHELRARGLIPAKPSASQSMISNSLSDGSDDPIVDARLASHRLIDDTGASGQSKTGTKK